MLQIDDTIVSLDLFDEYFLCDLMSCKGICCVEGDAGAPIEAEELEKIEEVLPQIEYLLPEKSKEVIKKQGVAYIDSEGDLVTSIVDGAECVFSYKDEQGNTKCAIEKAFLEGKSDFRKPISCFLYPVRLDKYKDFIAVNYHRWNICECARKNGKQEKIPLYKFLKKPLIEKFGEEWYGKLEIAAKELRKNNDVL